MLPVGCQEERVGSSSASSRAVGAETQSCPFCDGAGVPFVWVLCSAWKTENSFFSFASAPTDIARVASPPKSSEVLGLGVACNQRNAFEEVQRKRSGFVRSDVRLSIAVVESEGLLAEPAVGRGSIGAEIGSGASADDRREGLSDSGPRELCLEEKK